MSEDEILEKAQLLMKAFGKEDTASTAEYKLLRYSTHSTHYICT